MKVTTESGETVRLHRRLLAIDRRVRPVRVDDHAQGMRRVPVRWCLLAGKNHLIGGHQRHGRHHAIAAERIAHDEVAPIRKRLRVAKLCPKVWSDTRLVSSAM